MSRLQLYKAYHFEMMRRGDLEPEMPALRYVADRFELNIEQRYWLAFLFGATYCVPTTFYIYNEFPDYENVDLGRLERWWKSNRERVIFQTDRRWVRSRNQFVPMVASYREVIGRGISQQRRFWSFLGGTPSATYQAAFAHMQQTFQFGRFAMFLYLEAVEELTGLGMEPRELDVKNALSSRNGLCYALGHDQLLDVRLPGPLYADLERRFAWLVVNLKSESPLLKAGQRIHAWNVETSLCAFKKLMRGKRWLNYYIDRQAAEIAAMETKVPEGVDWSVLWDHRREHFDRGHLVEYTPVLGDRVLHGLTGPFANQLAASGVNA